MDYPLYLIPQPQGFASIVDPDAGDTPRHLLVVHSQLETAEAFMERCGIEGNPRAIQNDREFQWVLTRLSGPVRDVVFDPSPDLEQGLRFRRRETIDALLQEHLKPDYSPWNYPVFVVRQGKGYASIQGRQSEGETWQALTLFTSRQRAETYLEQAGESGETRELAGVQEVRDLLAELSEQATAVALNPVAEAGQRSAKHCFPVSTLLEKYLVRAEPGGEA